MGYFVNVTGRGIFEVVEDCVCEKGIIKNEQSIENNVTASNPLQGIQIYENPEGKLIQITVTNACSGCGGCSTMSKLFLDGKDGIAVPADAGIAPEEKMQEAIEVADFCPDDAIKIKKVSLLKSTGEPKVEDVKKLIQEVLVAYQYPRPKYRDYAWTSYRPDVDGEGFYIWSGYDYSSYKEAERAGLRELERVIFDKIDTHISVMLAEYKHEQLTPLITYQENENNFYYRETNHIEKLISVIALEVKAVTGKDINALVEFDKSKLIPDFGYKGKNFDYFTRIEDRTGMVKRDLHSSSWYDSWIDTDDMDTVEYGRFRSKEVTKWAFRVHDAVRKIFDDLNSGGKSGMHDYFDNAINGAYGFSNLIKPIEKYVQEFGTKCLQKL